MLTKIADILCMLCWFVCCGAGKKNEAVARAAAAVYTCAGFYISMAVVLHGFIYLPGTLPDTFIVMPRCGALPINLMSMFGYGELWG